MDIKNCDGLELLKTLENNSIDLILTDPPYIISRNSGMDKYMDQVKPVTNIPLQLPKLKKMGDSKSPQLPKLKLPKLKKAEA